MHGVHIWDNSHILKVSQFHTFISTLNYQNTPKSLKTLFKSIPCNLLSNSKRLTTDRLLESLARQNSFQADRNQWGHTSISNCHNSQPTTQPQAGEENRYPQLDHMVMSTKISRWLCQWEWHKNWGKKSQAYTGITYQMPWPCKKSSHMNITPKILCTCTLRIHAHSTAEQSLRW